MLYIRLASCTVYIICLPTTTVKYAFPFQNTTAYICTFSFFAMSVQPKYFIVPHKVMIANQKQHLKFIACRTLRLLYIAIFSKTLVLGLKYFDFILTFNSWLTRPGKPTKTRAQRKTINLQ